MRNMLRVAAVTPKVHIGNVRENVRGISDIYRKYQNAADIIVTPELSLTGYTCADLFENRHLIETAMGGLMSLAKLTEAGGAALVAGLPYEHDGELYNCAAVILRGRVLALIPKTYLPNYGEFYEKRWFSAGSVDAVNVRLYGGVAKSANRSGGILNCDVPGKSGVCSVSGGADGKNADAVNTPGGASDGTYTDTLFGNNIIIELGAGSETVKVGIEICEDAWTPVSPGRLLALAGAEVIVNISASNEVIGKEQYRRRLVTGMSADCLCGYVYVSAGMYESTSDLVFSGHNIICQGGKLLGEVKPFEDGVLVRDICMAKIRHDRIANKSYADCRRSFADLRQYTTVKSGQPLMEKKDMLMRVPMTPFVPGHDVLGRCLSIFRMQVAGLWRRIEATHCKCVVVGVSGGLDSTLALLVCAQAVKNAGLPPTAVLGITMPGFGTTSRTKNNSTELMRLLGCDSREISIAASVRQHFADIGQDENVHDITYENCQARERTQILMDVANKEGGFVVGTGDLSELALGWCTYNGDHMSMYAVNTSIPKTLVRTLVDEIGHHMEKNGFAGIAPIIEDIIDTPVSPELLPPNADGTIAQKTEDTVGSYILHDFFLYYTLRYGMSPSEVNELCREAVKQSCGEYAFTDAEIEKWQKVFYRRFFGQQFKRDCMPDGVKVGTVSVSPRGDLRLPSEAYFT